VGRCPQGPSDDWHDALVWMKENTPEPFDNPDFYYELYEEPPAGESYSYPESAYGVMSWWDYGYWITYTAQRIPNANPGKKNAEAAGSFFIAQDESSANAILDEHSSKYVIVDYDMARGKFYAMIEWAGENRDDFFEIYYQRQEGRLAPVLLYYPGYYQSMSSRLYDFEGQAVTPVNSTWVISYEELLTSEEVRVKVISDIANNGNPFATYEDALAFLELPQSSNYRIVGTNPSVSPVPLEELEHYNLVYKTPPKFIAREGATMSFVKVFEYSP